MTTPQHRNVPALRRWTFVAFVGLSSCGGAEATVTETASAPPRASAAAPKPTASEAPMVASTVATVYEEPLAPAEPTDADLAVRVELPKAYAHDGSIGEWGDVCSPLPSAAGGRAMIQPMRRTREPAPTCATLALTPDQVVIAGKLGDGQPSMWLGLTMPLATRFPGPTRRETFGPSEVRCDTQVEAGLASLCARHMKVVARASESTARFYEIKPSGVTTRELRGGLPAGPVVTVPAKLATSADGKTFELVLPLGSLPRAGAAPVQEVFLIWGTGGLPTTHQSWQPRKLPIAVSFEPFASLRDEIVAGVNTSGSAIALYQPGADEIEMFSASGAGALREVSGKKRKLFLSKIKTDSLEAGFSPGAPYDVLAVRAKGGAVRLVPLGDWRGVDVGVVDGEPRAFTLFSSCGAGSPCGATIVASRIESDGKLTPIDLEPAADVDTSAVDSATPYVQGGGTVFGIRGTMPAAGAHPAYDLRWSWDAKKKAYVGVQTGAR